ncbi:hypothetical protein HD806DRAFT_541632 [Xylariaceae sp. AK1471]|nr:hypothetical protein HD806DRAFT_541632 [Xylariaceae sp. AK1471]
MADQDEDSFLHSVLGIRAGADANEIKRAYHKLALTQHPDKRPWDPNATANFQMIQWAYETLIKNPGKRQRYNAEGTGAAQAPHSNNKTTHKKKSRWSPRQELAGMRKAEKNLLSNVNVANQDLRKLNAEVQKLYEKGHALADEWQAVDKKTRFQRCVAFLKGKRLHTKECKATIEKQLDDLKIAIKAKEEEKEKKEHHLNSYLWQEIAKTRQRITHLESLVHKSFTDAWREDEEERRRKQRAASEEAERASREKREREQRECQAARDRLRRQYEENQRLREAEEKAEREAEQERKAKLEEEAASRLAQLVQNIEEVVEQVLEEFRQEQAQEQANRDVAESS